MSDMKPCPYCGCEPASEPWVVGDDTAIQCSNCGATGGWQDKLEPVSLVAMRWNRRAPYREALVKVARLAITRCCGSYPEIPDPESVVTEYLALEGAFNESATKGYAKIKG